MGIQIYTSPKRKRSAPPQFSVHVHCGQTAGWIKTALGMEVGRGPGHIVLDGIGTQLTSPKRGGAPSPIFGPFLLWANVWLHQGASWYEARSQPRRLCIRWRDPDTAPQKGSRAPNFRPMCIVAIRLHGSRCYWYGAIGLGPDDTVLDGDPAPLPKNGAEHPPQFSAHVYCGQTAGWIKMAIGVEVDLRPGHTVHNGDPAPSQKRGHSLPIFGTCLLWPNGWMDQDATSYGGRPGPNDIIFHGDPATPQKGKAPNFRPMSIVAKRLYVSG